MRRYNISKRMLSLLLVLALSLPSVFQVLAAEESAVGTTVQLAKTEGTVSVTNANDRKATILKNMKLYNGYHVSTEEKSYSWINLDSTKLIKEDASSQVEIRESGKKLEVLLNSGNLFFNVTKDLEEEETLNIRTSTMVAGIRGTCGWVRVVDRWNTYVYILEGRVECRVADPVTGQIKKTILTGGEQANFVVYPRTGRGTSATSSKSDSPRQTSPALCWWNWYRTGACAETSTTTPAWTCWANTPQKRRRNAGWRRTRRRRPSDRRRSAPRRPGKRTTSLRILSGRRRPRAAHPAAVYPRAVHLAAGEEICLPRPGPAARLL